MQKLDKAKYLTVRWNNILTVGLGVPALAIIIAGFAASFWDTRMGFIALFAVGAPY